MPQPRVLVSHGHNDAFTARPVADLRAAGTDVWDYVPRAGVLLLTRRIFTPLEFAAEKHAARHFEATEAPTAA